LSLFTPHALRRFIATPHYAYDAADIIAAYFQRDISLPLMR